MKIIPTLLAVGGILGLAGKLGFNTKKLLNLQKFSDKADFKIHSIHQFKPIGGINGYLKFLVDIDVINPENFSITAENLLVKAYNEKQQYIGESLPYKKETVIAENSTTTLKNIEVHVKTSAALFNYGLPAILNIIQTGQWQNMKLNQTIALHISITLNGYEINKVENYKI